MADDDKLKPTTAEAIQVVSAAASTALLEIGKQFPALAGQQPLLSFLAVLLPALNFSIRKIADHYTSDRLPKFAANFAEAYRTDSGETAEQIAAKVELTAQQQADNPDYHEVMYRAFRQLQDAVDPEVVEVLGYLAGQYTFARKKADAYFRGLGRLLSDLESHELHDLRVLIVGVLKQREKVNEPTAALGLEQTNFNNQRQVSVRVSAPGELLWMPAVPSAMRLFWLLRREGLAQDQGPAHGMRREMGDNAIRIDFSVAEAIRQTIDPRRMVPG